VDFNRQNDALYAGGKHSDKKERLLIYSSLTVHRLIKKTSALLHHEGKCKFVPVLN